MNIFMSFILYNPLEAIVLILPFWILNRNNIDWKNKSKVMKIFVKDVYTLSTIFLLVQIPLNFISETLFYTIYNVISCVLFTIYILYKYCNIRFGQKRLGLSFIIEILYYISLNIIILSCQFTMIVKDIGKDFIKELTANLYIKFVQFFFMLIILGGIYMFKKILKNLAKKNIGSQVASTQHGYGEPKLSEKLASEVKNAK